MAVVVAVEAVIYIYIYIYSSSHSCISSILSDAGRLDTTRRCSTQAEKGLPEDAAAKATTTRLSLVYTQPILQKICPNGPGSPQ